MFRRLVTFGEESTYGVPATSPDRLFGWVTEFSGGVKTVSDPMGILDGSRLKRTIVYGLDVAPSISFLPTSGAPFKYALGSVADTGAEPPYTHRITISQGYRLPSITILEHRLGASSHGFRYVGCVVESLEASWEADGPLECSLEFVGQRVEQVGSLPSPAEDAGDPFRAEMVNVNIDGQEYGYATGGSLSLTNNHTPLPRGPDGFTPGHIANSTDIEATLSLHYMDPSIISLMLNRESFDVTIRFTRGANDRVEFKLLRCVAEVDAPLGAEEELVQELRLRAEDLEIVAMDSRPTY